MAAMRLEAAAPAKEEQAFAAHCFLHLFRVSQSINVGVSVSYPSKVIPSPLSDEVGLLDIDQESENKRKSLP